jgi:sugar phosphate isomerase/epimerase
MAEINLVFWPACVRLKPFREHVAAAAAGGFTSIAIAAETVHELQDAGLSIRDIQRIAQDANVPIQHYDTLAAWAPIRVPPGASKEMRARFDVSLEESLELCEELGVTHILAAGGYPPDSVPLPRLIEGFADLCRRADKLGMWVDLEFMPILGLRDLATAWSIVGAVAASNSGLMIDTWHFAKSHSSLELLKSIDARYLRSFQVSDGYRSSRGRDLLEELLFYRRFPGEGELNVVAVLAAVYARGSLRQIGSEVFSHEANEMTALAAGAHSGATLRRVMSTAGIPTDA